MNPNSSLSFEDKNEFMPNQQVGPDPMFNNFMQACFKDPAFFQSMKQFYNTQSNQQRPPQGLNKNELQSSYAANQSNNNPKNQSKLNQESQYSGRNYRDADSKRLLANPLLKYQPPQYSNHQNTQRKNAQEQNYLQEKPIKSNYIQTINNNPKASLDLNAIKQNQSINIDIVERPIKGGVKASYRQNIGDEVRAQKQKQQQFDQRPIKSMSKTEQDQYYQQFEKKPKKNLENSSMTANFDDRPIQGSKKDFKQILKEQCPEPFQEYQNQAENDDKKNEPKTFLKRGSRQHLSSAANRSKQKKNADQDLNKSGLDRSRDLTPKNLKNDTRSTSQNRILGKRTTKENIDKSINKGVKNVSHPIQSIPSKPPNPNNKSKVTASKKAQSITPQIPKKKAKNVFADNSSESSSDEEPFFKAIPKKSEAVFETQKQDKIQVIEDVFLTNEQLEQILKKYGKASKPIVKESESEKIQAIRSKYTQLCQLVESEKQAHLLELQREKDEFEKYKADQLNKLKNEKRVMERQLKSGSSNQNLQKQKEQLQTLKMQIQRERQEFKKRDKNNKIMIEKFKKQNEQLKNKFERLEMEKAQVISTKKSFQNIKQDSYHLDDKVTTPKIVFNKPKVEQQEKQQRSYKDLKKKQPKQVSKVKYQYAQEQPVVKSKITNLQKEQKIQNKWISNKFNNNSQQEPSDQEISKEDESSSVEWSPAMKLSDLTKMELSIKMVTDKMINALFKHESNIQFRKYQQTTNSPSRTVVNTNRNAKNCYVANLYSDRSKELIYDNGTRKESFENGYTIVYFKNGDIKQTLSDKTVLYYFKEKEVDQITLPNGVNIYRFENNQVQFHFTNGFIEIRHPDGTIKVLGEHNKR